jgi:hypothetical protein
LLKEEIDVQRELVQALQFTNKEERENTLSLEAAFSTARGEFSSYQTQVEEQQKVISDYIDLELEGTQLYEEAVEQLAYLQALLTLSETAFSSAEAEEKASFFSLEESDLKLNTEVTKFNELTKELQTEQEGLYPYIEFVVNIGTIGNGNATAPDFELHSSSLTPSIGERVTLRALVVDGNTSAYAYSWYINESQFDEPGQLNQPVISTVFAQSGHYVVRVVVSDMKGGISSKNLVLSVGDVEQKNMSLVTGTVRSKDGFLQGARVVIEEAPVVTHDFSMSGNLRDSFYPSGDGNPATFFVDGQVAPELTFHRGEVHRFYFDKSLEDYNVSFLEKPENNPPRIKIHMLTDPRVSLSGNAYYRNPDVNFTTRSAFSSHLSTKIGTYLEMLEYLQEHNQSNGIGQPLVDLNETDFNDSDYLDLLEYLKDNNISITRFNDINGTRKANEVMNPYPKALLSESNVTKGIVGPTFANELGYITFGGRGYDRNDTPRVDVRRSSIWEDYNSTNAVAIANVDGVGTISPVNAVSPHSFNIETSDADFLGSSWALRNESASREVTIPDNEDDPTLQLGSTTSLPAVPDLVVWGSGGGHADDPLSEVNASVSAWKSGDNNIRTINIFNQGKGFEPNSTMAVLHYPRDPFAYWSFDRHETLFEDRNHSRHQPSPAWNRELSGIGDRLTHYWKMDDEVNSTTSLLNNETNGTAFLNLDPGPDAQSTWGLLGRAIKLNGNQDLNASNVLPEGNFTLSFWSNLQDDLNITVGGLPLNYNFTDKEAELGGSGGLSKIREDIFNEWMHIAVTFDENASLYVDGRKESAVFIPSDRDLTISNLNGLLDEIKIYDVVLSEPQVRYLSGRNFLDLSGNKYHAVPVGRGFIPVSPEAVADVPEEFSYPNTPVIGTQIMSLGDSFPGEDHGRSLSFDGVDDHLDLSSHLLDFGLPEGTICMWVKTTTSQTAPLLWISSPLEITSFEIPDQNTSETLITPGNFFAFEIANGMPRLGGITAFDQNNKVNDDDWHHVAASFPSGNIWVDGARVDIATYGTEDVLFSGTQSPLDFIVNADQFYIGKAPDRTQPNEEILFNGRLDDVIFYDRILTNDEVYYLYELRRGREQIPRLEAIVDAIGTVEIIDGGSGYRENPDLVFWYGENNETPNDLPAVPTDANLSVSKSQGSLTFVTDEAQVYSYHEGKASFRDYKWRMGTNNDNGWRKHVAAAGIVEFGDPDSLLPNLEDIVWTQKLDFVTWIPLPDGRWDKRLYVDYVTMDRNLSSSSVINKSHSHPYFKPNGLGGFVERPDFAVASPEEHNPDALAAYAATAYGLFFVDHDQNDSLTIVDGGSGFDVPDVGFDLTTTDGKPFSILQFKVRGKSYQPEQYLRHTHTYAWDGIFLNPLLGVPPTGNDFTLLAEEDWNNITWNDVTFGTGWSFLKYDNLFNTGYHISNDPKNSFVGRNWEQVLLGETNILFDEVTVQTIDNNNTNEPYFINGLTIDANHTDLNKTIGSVSVDASGYGYSMPIELRVVGGRPMFDDRIPAMLSRDLAPFEAALGKQYFEIYANSDSVPNDIARGAYTFTDAEFNVTKIDSNGSILEVERLNGGSGYIPFYKLPKTDPYAETSFSFDTDNEFRANDKWYSAPNPPLDFHLNEFPFVSVSGGGGYGARIRITNIDITTGEILDINVTNGGRGYFNIDPQNKPVATLDAGAGPGGRDANLSVRLGGSLKEIPPCTGCSSKIHTDLEYDYSHLEPWIEIWDRGRSETTIDDLDASRPTGFPRVRAHAAPKVVDGRITKVVVINSGTGYIDPIAIVRDAPPKHHEYNVKPGVFSRNWVCTFIRTNQDGEEVACGHISNSMYPPDYCPGETDDTLPYEDENGSLYIATGDEIEAWRIRHNAEHKDCADETENLDHLNVTFISRKCWGTKMNYKLLNPIYRLDGDPDKNQTWAPLDAKLSVVSEGGRILRIEVMKEGRDYFASKLYVEGSGTGVDAIPVFNEFGVNTHVIFDDPRLTNDELDKLDYRSGAGQGFRERPWSWDNAHDSGFGGREKVKVYAWHSEVITDEGGLSHAAWDWNFGDPILNDNLGDRVVSIDILDPGLYASDFDPDGDADLNVSGVKIDYNATVTFHDSNRNNPFTKDMNASDHDGDGYADFSPAQVTTHGTYTITHTLLNHDSVMDFASIFPELGVFSETPLLEFHDERNLNGWDLGTDYVEETSSDFIRLNQKVSYDPEREQSYIELYVDDRFPNQLYYGLDLVEDATSRTLPRFGNLITVTEGLPGMNWATNEPATKAKYSYTDADGFYALPQLESGFYNVSVFMEDQKLQESSFRPDANISRISQILYLPGFPQLTLETDQHGAGRSSLVWAPAARRLSRPAENLSTREEFDQEYRVLKQLEGIGRGFDPDPSSPPPELTFVPDPNNVGITPPNIEVKVLVDGSLLLRIIDDENTSKYFPQDKFYVFHNSEISGVDFVETYLYSESNQTFASGTKAESTTGGILILSPNDGNGANPISAPVSTFEREWNQTSLSWEYLFKERPIQLRAIAYDENRTSVSTASVQWSAYLDFNSSEGNNSRIIQLEDENGTRGQEANGSAVNAYLFSLLRKGWVEDLNITHGGENYTEGSLVRLSGNGDGFLARVSEVNASTGAIEDVEILSHGENYSQSAVPYVVDKEGSGAILQPQLPYSGTVRIEANMTIPGESNSTIKSILLKPSLKYPLDSLESWRNRFTDSFWSDATDPNWLQTYLTEDNDTDGLTNEEEWSANTNPLSSDSDGDGLPDVNETQYFTNPWLPDTDGDGLTDSFELNVTTPPNPSPSNPLKYDTDKDGLSDGDDPDPSNSDGNGIISGIVVKSPMYDSNATVYFHCFSPDEQFPPTKWDSNWTDRMNNFYLTGKTAGNYTIRSFIDFQPQDGEYQYGEPYAEQNITLSAQSMEEMGRYLVPLDLAPEIKFYSPPGEGNFTQNSDFERNVTIDINDTNLIIDSFAYAVQAVDPYDKNRTLPAGVMWITDVNASFELGNPVNNVEFLVDGNFTPYMDFNQSRSDFNSTVKFDLDNTPVGKYYLSFRAVDSYGNISPAIIKNIEIRDTQPPYISLLDLENQKGATTFSETELKTIIEDVTFDINETNNSVVWQWPYGEPFQLVDLSNTDSINGMVIVHVLDTKNDVITDWGANYSYSDSNVSPELSANQIEDLNLNYVISDENNTNKIGTHKIIFVASDLSGNPLDFTLYLLVKPGYQSTITAVDGYLENAIVGFDADGDGVSDLDSDFRTNSSGKAEVLFTAAEFAKFDLNGNGQLDANEGNFIVLGGIDTSTGTVFSGKLFADASASVVSPLTTLISQMMVGGLSKEEAMKRVSLALGLDEGLDLTNYDPIQKAFEGEANATLVMMANLRIANLVNQSEGLLRALSEEYEGYEVGTDLLEEIAHWISTQKVPGLLDMEDALVDAIPVALASVGTVGELSIEDQLTMFQLMTDSDIQFTTFEEDMSFDELMTQQIAFIEDLDKLVQDLSDELSTTKLHYLTLEPSEGGKVYGGEKNHPYGSEVEIVAQAEENFKFIEWRGEGIEDSKSATTNVLMVEDRNITALFERISSEEYTETDRNLDEEDGSDLPEKEDSANLYYLALEPSEGGKVYGGGNHPSGSEVEIVAQAEENFKFVEWRGEGVEDSKSAITNVNMVEDRNITALFERISSEEESGSQGEAFYYYLSSEDLSDGKNLFTLQTPEGSMATFFEISSGNLDMDEDGQKLFELSSFGDFKLNDLDEVKKLAGSKVSLSVLVDNPSGKTSEILGNVEFAHELFLMSKSLGNSWYSSPWLGIFMKNKLDSSWVFHYPLGWVYIHPSQNNSYWLWPEKLDEWLWTNENLFPQTYSASSLTWLYFHIDNENIRIFDYDQQSWEILP